MITSTLRRFRGTLFVALVAAFGLAAPAGPASGGSDEVREIRDAVPLGKEEGRFGRITELPADIKTPPSTPLQVRLLASKAPALNEAVTITLQTHAFEGSPGTTVSIELPDGAKVLEGAIEELVDLEAGQTHELTVVVALTKLGEQTIEGKASRAVSEDQRFADDDALHVTVEKEGGFVGHRSGDDAELETTRVSDDIAGEPRNVPRAPHDDDPPLPQEGTPVTLEVCWTFAQRGSGTAFPLRNARVLFKDEDDPWSGWDDLLASGYTDRNGCASASVLNGDSDDGGDIDVYAVLFMEHAGYYRIENLAGVVFQCKTSATVDVAADLNLGTQQCGGMSGNGRAAWLYNDAYLLRRFVDEHRAGRGKQPGECRVQWQTASTTGTFYSLSDGRVHLTDGDAASRDVAVHECSHSYMHTAYGVWPASPNCSSHQINRVSSAGCAWTEGWTYVLVAGTDGDPIWRNGGSVFDLEKPNCLTPTATMDAGPSVEGRVGGVLIDLLDVFTLSYGTVTGFTEEFFNVSCFGADSETARFADFWDVFTSQNADVFVVQGGVTNSFSRAWQRLLPATFTGGGTVYGVGGKFYYCADGGNCVGRLNSIPTFAQD